MALTTKSRLAMALLAGAAGVYAAVYAVVGGNWFKMSDSELSRIQGCYAVARQELFKIEGRTLFTSGGTIGFEGWHEKGRDVLVLDRPVRLARHPQFVLVRQGTLTKVPIIYYEPVRLQLWDENDRPMEASKTDCRP